MTKYMRPFWVKANNFEFQCKILLANIWKNCNICLIFSTRQICQTMQYFAIQHFLHDLGIHTQAFTEENLASLLAPIQLDKWSTGQIANIQLGKC